MRLFARTLLDWLPFTAVMVCYDLSWGAADHIGWPATVDQRLFGAIPTVWLQHRLHPPGIVHWYKFANLLMYFLFFFAVPLTMTVLRLRDRT